MQSIPKLFFSCNIETFNLLIVVKSYNGGREVRLIQIQFQLLGTCGLSSNRILLIVSMLFFNSSSCL